MNFLKKVGKSIYSPAFYQEFLSAPIKKSFRYFFGVAVILSIISATVISIDVVPKAKAFLSDFGTTVIANYPSELEVTIKGGVASTNVSEPYVVKLPQDKEKSDKSAHLENLLVIDTTQEFTVARFEEYKTFVLLTKNLLVYNDDGKITIQKLNGVPDVVVNQAFVSKWANKIMPFLSNLALALPILLFIVFLLGYVFKLVYFLVAALLVMLFLHFKKVKVSYERAYQISIHAYTLPILVLFILGLFGVYLPIPFLPTILLLVITMVNVKKVGSPSIV